MIDAIHNYGYIGVFITIILEIGFMVFPLPGDSLLFASGMLAESGKMNLFTIFTASTIASIIAGHIGYFVGEKIGGERLQNNPIFPIDKAHFKKAHDFVEKYGALALIFSRFIPVVRSFISPTLAMVGYSKYSFALYNFVASVMWAATVIMTGYLFGRAFPQLLKYIEILMIMAFAASVAPFAYTVIKNVIVKKFSSK